MACIAVQNSLSAEQSYHLTHLCCVKWECLQDGVCLATWALLVEIKEPM